MDTEKEVFLGVMDLQEAKTHQLKLKENGITVTLKTHGSTCTTGCKVTVEVWGNNTDVIALQSYFSGEFMKHVKGHEPNFDYLTAVFDSSASEVTCQACGARFSPTLSECPDCGLCYS